MSFSLLCLSDIIYGWKWKDLKVKSLSCVRLFATHGLQPPRLLGPWDFPGMNTGVGCHFLLQRIFPTQGLNLGLLHYRQTLYHLSYQGNPYAFMATLPLITMNSDVKSLSHVQLFTIPWTVACHVPLSMGFSRQECWSGLPFPSLGDLSDPGIEPGSSALQADFSLSALQRKLLIQLYSTSWCSSNM